MITAAAGILALNFAAYATGGVVLLKELGVGAALTIVVDATLSESPAPTARGAV